MAQRTKLSKHQHVVVARLKAGNVLKAALRRGSEGQVLGMGPWLWYQSAGRSLDMRAITMDTIGSLRGKGIIRIEDRGDWSCVVLCD
jgi:hypothetical protein